LRKAVLVKGTQVEGKPFILDDFIQSNKGVEKRKRVTKKFLKDMANELGLEYDEKQIVFTKKIITAYLER
jgi:hypothetical protein